MKLRAAALAFLIAFVWIGVARADQEADANLAFTRAMNTLAVARVRLAEAKVAAAEAAAQAAAAERPGSAAPTLTARLTVPQEVVVQAAPAAPSPFAAAAASIVSSAAEALLTIAGLLLTALVTAYGQRAVAAIEGLLHVKLDDQQRQAVYAAIDTARGQVETLIDQNKLKISDVTTTNEAVRGIATDALNRVPDSAKAQKMTVDAACEMVVGRVNTTKPPLVIMQAPRTSPPTLAA